MGIVTKTGDQGTTGLWGGKRVPKNCLRVEAYGSCDELASFIGLAASQAKDDVKATLQEIQVMLFCAAADLAKEDTANPLLKSAMLDRLQELTFSLQEELPEQRGFLLPGGVPQAAYLHVARTVCRRCERAIVALSQENPINPVILPFFNRLSDYLFLAARAAQLASGEQEIPVKM